MWEQIAAIGSVGIACLSIFGSWLAWRRAALKGDDVLNWAMRVIAAQRTIALLTDPKFGAGTDASETAKQLAALAIETSVLTECGRKIAHANLCRWRRRKSAGRAPCRA